MDLHVHRMPLLEKSYASSVEHFPSNVLCLPSIPGLAGKANKFSKFVGCCFNLGEKGRGRADGVPSLLDLVFEAGWLLSIAWLVRF